MKSRSTQVSLSSDHRDDLGRSMHKRCRTTESTSASTTPAPPELAVSPPTAAGGSLSGTPSKIQAKCPAQGRIERHDPLSHRHPRHDNTNRARLPNAKTDKIPASPARSGCRTKSSLTPSRTRPRRGWSSNRYTMKRFQL